MTEILYVCVQCIMHLEDRMQELYFKSLMLAEYIKGMGRYNLHHLNTVLGFVFAYLFLSVFLLSKCQLKLT